jgi:integrase/recombinase XerC
VNKHKGLQQFFKWLLVDEQAIQRSPMERVRLPMTPTKLVPALREEDTGLLLAACLYVNTGARLAEVGNLLYAGPGQTQGRRPAEPVAGRAGTAPLTPNGIKIRLKRPGAAAGVPDVHAHRWRHSFAHQWKLAGGDTGDLMLVLGWSSDDMPRHYGASAAAERALQTHARLGIGERI